MVDGSAMVTRKYWDDETEKFIDVTMTVRDHILFKRLAQIASTLKVK